MAGCATPTSSAGHPGCSATANHALTLTPDHLVGAGHCHDRHQQDRRERPAALPLREANRRGPCLPARRPLSKLRQWRAPAIEWLRREGAGSMSLRQDTGRVVMAVGRGTRAGPTLSTKTLQFIGSLRSCSCPSCNTALSTSLM